MNVRAAAVIALAVVLAGCHQDGVLLTVRADGLVADQLRFTATFDGHSIVRLRPDPAASSPLVFPQTLLADFGARAADVSARPVKGAPHGPRVAIMVGGLGVSASTTGEVLVDVYFLR